VSGTVLVLGGTSEAVAFATLLEARAPGRVLTSLAGRTTSPRALPGRTRVGGFGGTDGLVHYLMTEAIGAVVDATHPFATRIGRHAAEACARARVPLLALVRPAWAQQPGDRWHRVPDVATAALRAAELGTRIFVTVGSRELAPFAALGERCRLVRAIEPPHEALPPGATLELARGPFEERDERALMLRYQIDVLVTKDSGGDATIAKLAAARALAIPVVVIDRPARPAVARLATPQDALAWLESLP